MVRKFSLLKLPSLAQQHVIKIMDCPEKITVSMCSQKMKNLVRRLNFRAKCFSTFVDGYGYRVVNKEVGIDIRFRSEKNAPGYFEISELFWGCTARGLKDWLDLIKYIYTCDRYSLLFIDGCQKFEVQNIQKEFEQLKLDELRLISNFVPNEYYIEILHEFSPIKKLMITKNPFPTREALQYIVFRPYDCLTLHTQFPNSVIELINLNAIKVECWKCDITEEDLNFFLRLWKHGEYPKLDSMFLKMMQNDLAEKKVFEEMEYEEKMENVGDEEIKKYWIKNLDGKKATIRFSEWKKRTDVYFKIQN